MQKRNAKIVGREMVLLGVHPYGWPFLWVATYLCVLVCKLILHENYQPYGIYVNACYHEIHTRIFMVIVSQDLRSHR